ncbi:MAG: thiosulfohydrolase SoxB [Rhodospirillales bacterium]|tara:strand:- start:48336 stop:50024 length:1689 start_codon:yes stop_codon:yes gene_type:complete
MQSRRDFLELAAITAMLLGSRSWSALAAKQELKSEDLLKFDSKGQITLLHVTDLHGQLKPVYFRPPSENYGVGKFEGIPPHLVGEAFLEYFGINPNTPLAYAHSMIDYIPLAIEYGKLGGLDRTATAVKQIRAERGDDKVLFLDGGDTWQGSYTSLKTQGADMVTAMNLLKPDAMVGHWEFTFGKRRLKQLLDKMNYPFLGGNVFDTEWDEAVFESTRFFEKGGINVAVIGQHFPYTAVANPSYMVEGWSFGIRPEIIQKNIDLAKKKGAEVIVLLSHNGFDVDQKLATILEGVDVILTGHTHDAIPRAIKIKNTLLLSSGSHGKYLGRIDLNVKDGKVIDYSSNLIPIFSDVIEPDKEMTNLINELRSPYEDECNRTIGKAETLLYRRGNFNGSWDDVMCDAIIEERDAEISLSPGFRWGTTLLPGQNITIDDIYSQTSMNYPEVYRTQMNGETIKNLLEDVCDNIFNEDPFYQQGGDMVRVGGISYTCTPKNPIGKRISNLEIIKSGDKIEPTKTYVVGGWGSVKKNTQGPPMYKLLEKYITRKKLIKPNHARNVKVLGV